MRNTAEDEGQRKGNQEQVERTHTHQTRRCYVEEAPHLPTAKFFPNYMIISNCINLEQPRPTSPTNRYDALFPWLQTRHQLFHAKAQSTGVLYIGTRNKRTGVVNLSTASTFFILSINGHRIPITTLHAIQHSSISLDNLALFVTPKHNMLDLYSLFKSSQGFFEQVGVRKDLLQFRKDYIMRLAQIVTKLPTGIALTPSVTPNTPGAVPTPPTVRPSFIDALDPTDAKLIYENLDPKYFMLPTPVLDFLVLDFPPTVINQFPASNDILIAATPPVAASPVITAPAATPAPAPAPAATQGACALIGFHDTSPESGKDIQDEYSATTTAELPQPVDYLYSNCSLSLGLVKEVGSGIINLEMSTAGGSSGGPILNDNGEVFAINIWSFYDSPGHAPPRLFSVSSPNDLLGVDIYLPESPNSVLTESRNRVQGLSMFHSGVQELLSRF